MLKDPELGLPEEQDLPAQALAVGMRVRVKAMGITGELMSLQGEDAEVAISGKRLRLPQGELVAWSFEEPRIRTGDRGIQRPMARTFVRALGQTEAPRRPRPAARRHPSSPSPSRPR